LVGEGMGREVDIFAGCGGGAWFDRFDFGG
jgi:hypothetical protein